MYLEDEYIMLSALQHYLFCPRQCALIHLEQLWEDNSLTMQGNILHEHVHDAQREKRGTVIIARGLRLSSARLGLSGQADVVEFHQSEHGCTLPNAPGRWQPFPVEYKRGRPKRDHCDAVQLCAQALCLEEMLTCQIPCGALYYGKTRRRNDVRFTPSLREETERCVAATHALLNSGTTPPPVADARCNRCSLNAHCLPDPLSHSLSHYYKLLLEEDAP
ncbi:CRISPR-associated protein Cas4 [candidate division KSB3 bacterium]|uniref:CRISPR-associated exonuclease Cas4 n=1 Tax=candidate division KSB3 bacterium TaxID=2044937 RepID=A0A9D5JTG8_9BACT|nr:CRISPR-associated protein Cas4 [candidate division KSB3 bacterium]